MLFCEEVPPWGGDTQWAAMGPTFEAFSPGLQATLLGLSAIHANVRKLGYSYAQTDPPEPSIAEYDAAEGPVHPVVRLIPETGRRVLYVNPEFTTRFEGWTRRESLPLLNYLFAFGTRPEFIARFRWAPGSIAMWDNRQTWHFAVNDYQGQRRVMHRILLAGSKPELQVGIIQDSALISPDFGESHDNDNSGWKNSQLACSEVSDFGQG
jgi:taurine dioxygenase